MSRHLQQHETRHGPVWPYKDRTIIFITHNVFFLGSGDGGRVGLGIIYVRYVLNLIDVFMSIILYL